MNDTIIRDPDSHESLVSEWQSLWRASMQATAFCQPSWLLPWWRTLGRRSAPYIAAAYERGSLSAVAPLTLHRTLAGGVLRPAGEGVSDYTDWLLTDEPEIRQTALDRIVDLLVAQPDWIATEIPGLRNAEDTHVLQHALERRGLQVRILAGLWCPHVAMPDGFEKYFRTRGSRTRYNVRSRGKRLGELGRLRYEHATVDSAPRALEQAIALHGRRWRGQRTSTVFSSSTLGRAFYRATVPQLIERGAADLATLTLNDEVIAAALGFLKNDEYSYYLPSWHPGYHPYAPSTLLLVHLMERASQRGAKLFDFMLGDEQYKSTWATGGHRVQTLLATRPSVRGRAWLLSRLTAHGFKERARSSPRLVALRRYGPLALIRTRPTQEH